MRQENYQRTNTIIFFFSFVLFRICSHSNIMYIYGPKAGRLHFNEFTLLAMLALLLSETQYMHYIIGINKGFLHRNIRNITVSRFIAKYRNILYLSKWEMTPSHNYDIVSYYYGLVFQFLHLVKHNMFIMNKCENTFNAELISSINIHMRQLKLD